MMTTHPSSETAAPPPPSSPRTRGRPEPSRPPRARFVGGGIILRGVRLGVALTAMIDLAGCPSPAPPSGFTGSNYGCNFDDDCASGFTCDSWTATSGCAKLCSTNADCEEGMACGVPPDHAARYCVAGCTPSSNFGYGACVDGTPTACDAVPARSYCIECGNPCPSGQRCDAPTDACVPLLAVGFACTSSGECLSNNCGTLPGTSGMQCFVGAGAACTAQNCGSCDTAMGGSGCAQSCTQDTDCPVYDYAGSCHPMFQGQTYAPRYLPCLGNTTDGYYCREPCDGVTTTCPPGTTCAPYTPGACSDYLFDDACFP